MKGNLIIKISSSFNAAYIFDTKNFYDSLCALKFKYLPLNHPCFNQFFFINMFNINKDTIHHFMHK